MPAALKAQIREGRGKGANRRLRSEKKLPAVLYGKDSNMSLALNPKELKKIVDEQGINTLLDLNIEGDTQTNRVVILKDHQEHPLKEGWVHADFYEIDMTKEIKVQVPILLEGHSPAEKMGGLVEHSLHELELRCLPANIPHEIKVDMTQVKMDQVVHVSDLLIPENVEVINDSGDVVVSVHEVKVQEEAAPVEGEEGEGEVAAGAEPGKEADSAKTESKDES